MNNSVNNVNNFFAPLKISGQKMSNYSGFEHGLYLEKIVIKLFQQVINSFTHRQKTCVKSIMKPKNIIRKIMKNKFFKKSVDKRAYSHYNSLAREKRLYSSVG